MLTYSSAVAAVFTGAVAVTRQAAHDDRLLAGRAAFSASYAVIANVWIMLAVPPSTACSGRGCCRRSARISATSSRRTDARRAWAITASHRACARARAGRRIVDLSLRVSPVCLSAAIVDLVMAGVGYALPSTDAPRTAPLSLRGAIEWRVFTLSGTLFLYYFGYGGVTSFVALYATRNHVSPPGIYFTMFAASAVATTLFAGPLGDRFGHTRLFVPALGLIAIAYGILAYGGERTLMIASALIFGLAFRAGYQLYTAHVLHLVDADRRGAAFGGIISALDTGVGTGSIAMGWIIDHYGFSQAFGTAAILAAAAIPYFLVANRRMMRGQSA
jgi:hypothetical protein